MTAGDVFVDEDGTEYESREAYELEQIGQTCGYDSDEYRELAMALER